MGVLGIIAAVVVAFLIGRAIGSVFVGVLAAAGLVAWFRFNVRQATVGLFDGNLRAYWNTRAAGATHEQAIARVITSRYGFEPARQEKIRTDLEDHLAWTPAIKGLNEAERQAFEVKMLVWLIFCNENGRPPTEELRQRFWLQIDNAYARFADAVRLRVSAGSPGVPNRRCTRRPRNRERPRVSAQRWAD